MEIFGTTPTRALRTCSAWKTTPCWNVHNFSIMDVAYVNDLFDSIPSIISQARRHLHDTNFEVIQCIHRRLGDCLYLMNHLVSRACGILTVIDADRQDDFYSLMIAVRSFCEAYLGEISANESWDDCQATFGYQQETQRSRARVVRSTWPIARRSWSWPSA